MYLIKKYKCGDVREDGKIFLSYEKKCKNGERWVTKEQFQQRKIAGKKYRIKNKEKLIIQQTEWIKKNRKRATLARSEWAKRNPEKIRNTQNKYRRNKLIKNPVYLLTTRIRVLTGQAFRLKGYTKKSRTYEYLGCSWEVLKEYIEKKFKTGMTWGNRNLWHIDHIIPLGSAKTEQELIKLCHYTNLQPLWAKENQKKSNKIQ